jgi:predicted naringenin-chalcone synthase
VLSLGTANPPERYSQQDVLALFDTTDPRIRGLFISSHIRTRHLYLPPKIDGRVEPEPQEVLVRKHKQHALEVGAQAIDRCLEPLGLKPRDIDYLACVTSTGFLCPGISAWLIKQHGFREDVHRIDILGMGCNAGVNGLNPVSSFAAMNPGRLALMLCVEICSAAYFHDGSMQTAIVNSLFGDGAAAVLLAAGERAGSTPLNGPRVLGFDSHIIPDAIGTMRFDQAEGGRLSFFLDRDIPYVIGANVEKPVGRLLRRFGLKKRQIAHWVVHSGGRKVVDSVKYNLGLTDHDVRHTLRVLRDYGNLSSGSFLFSLKGLLEEGVAREGEYGVLMAMGPGASIETALVRW